MEDTKATTNFKKLDSVLSIKRLYKKPNIEEEEKYETCVVLGCGAKPGTPPAGCGPNSENS